MKTSAELDNLLLWLGQDAATGARRYVELRRKLVTLFAFRGCEAAEELADETMDRTARTILKPGFSFEGNPMAYLHGVARNVHLEYLRRNRTVSQELLPELADCVAQPSSGTSEVEQQHKCLDQCLARLPREKRSLLLRYYRGEKSAKIDARMQLAQEEGVEVTTLRIQLFRLRKSLRRCVERCTRSMEMEMRF